MVIFSKKSLFVSALLPLLLSACVSNRMGDAEQKMAEIRAQNAQPISPLPQPEPIEDFTYSASEYRSPFLAPSLISMQTQFEKNAGIKPDVNRKKEALEAYDLSQLIYHGRVVSVDGQEYGLIRLPDGYVKEVQVGEYMGKSDGRILEITPTQINIEEIVPDSRSGFTYKKTALVTPN